VTLPLGYAGGALRLRGISSPALHSYLPTPVEAGGAEAQSLCFTKTKMAAVGVCNFTNGEDYPAYLRTLGQAFVAAPSWRLSAAHRRSRTRCGDISRRPLW
jgi:hypothetical protein